MWFLKCFFPKILEKTLWNSGPTSLWFFRKFIGKCSWIFFSWFIRYFPCKLSKVESSENSFLDWNPLRNFPTVFWDFKKYLWDWFGNLFSSGHHSWIILVKIHESFRDSFGYHCKFKIHLEFFQKSKGDTSRFRRQFLCDSFANRYAVLDGIRL